MSWNKFILVVFFLSKSSLSQDASLNNKRFPPDFMFGAATAAFQIEGAWNEDGKSPSGWDVSNHQVPSIIADNQTADISCDSYHKYKEDVALLAAMGATSYRFSIAWTRILPTGFNDTINQLGVNYYKNLIAELKANNIEPMVTIFHWDLPQSLVELGGFYNTSSIDWFTNYARVVFDIFGDEVKYWFTLNEPYESCINDGVTKAYECAKNILKIHASIWHMYDQEFRAKQKGKLSLVLNLNWYEPESNSTDDIIAAETKMQFSWGLFAHPLYYGDWPKIMKSRIAFRSQGEGFNKSRLPEFTQEEIEYIKGTNDFFSVNSYTTAIIRAIDEPPFGEPTAQTDEGVYEYQPSEWQDSASSWLKVVPWGMRKLLRWFKQEYFDPEIIITETGYSDFDGRLDDPIRRNYLRDYLSNIRDAMVYDGVKLIAYNVWSLLDNFEWNLGYTVKFGLINVDFNDPNRTRTRKNSSYYYEQICKTKCILPDNSCID